MDDGFAVSILPQSQKKKIYLYFAAPIFFFFFFIPPLHFCLKTPISPPPRLKITSALRFFLWKKNSLLRSPHFTKNRFFWKKMVASTLAPFLGEIKIKVKIRWLAPFFSAENPSSIKLIWCDLVWVMMYSRNLIIHAINISHCFWNDLQYMHSNSTVNFIHTFTLQNS